MLSRNSGRALLSHLWSAVTGRTLSIDVSQPTVVDRIQRLQRLETVVYTMDKLVTGAKENRIFPDFLAGDRLLMMVHGEVVAGIDFSNLKPGDVRVDGKRIHLHLPASQVFRTRIDSAKTRVYSRQTGLLVSTDPNLETQVRQEAERQLQEAASSANNSRILPDRSATTDWLNTSQRSGESKKVGTAWTTSFPPRDGWAFSTLGRLFAENLIVV
jgi:hypothetical protein